MKLVLAAKSLPLKAINRTINATTSRPKEVVKNEILGI